MAESSESKPAFWSSLPGILTGVGGVIVATTGLITALYSAGVIGPNSNTNSSANANANTGLQLNSAAPLAAIPSPMPAVNPDLERYKNLAGKWKVAESPPQDTYFSNTPTVTWGYDAVVKGNSVIFTGKILYVDHPNDKPNKDEAALDATLEMTLNGLSGNGTYTFTPMEGEDVSRDATVRFKENLKEFDAEVKNETNGKTYKLKGRRQPNVP